MPRDTRPRRRVRVLTGAIAGLVALSSAATAFACTDSNTVEWSCAGYARAACYSPYDNHSWGQVSAINTANAYRKCAKMQNSVSGYVYVRNCYSATVVTATCGAGDGACGGNPNCQNTHIYVAVGNDTDQDHGLRGRGKY